MVVVGHMGVRRALPVGSDHKDCMRQRDFEGSRRAVVHRRDHNIARRTPCYSKNPRMAPGWQLGSNGRTDRTGGDDLGRRDVEQQPLTGAGDV